MYSKFVINSIFFIYNILLFEIDDSCKVFNVNLSMSILLSL